MELQLWSFWCTSVIMLSICGLYVDTFAASPVARQCFNCAKV